MVVSDGSPGSSLLTTGPSAAPLRVDDSTLSWISAEALRARLEAGTEVADCFFCCCLPGDGTADPVDSSPPSSPDASRDEGCRRSAVDADGLGTLTETVWEALRLRLPEAEVGDDMVA